MNERLTVFVSVIFWRARHREANGVHGLADSFAFPVNPTQNSETEYCSFMEQTWKGEKTIGIREEIKSYIIRSDMTEVVDRLYDNYNWSHIVPNLSGKLRRGSLRYQEAVELADVLDYDIVWVKRKR